MRKATLWRTKLQGANLEGAKLQEAKLRRADLKGVSLRNANLLRADLTDADLKELDASRTQLQGVQVRHANLDQTNLEWADLARVDLRDVESMKGSKLHRAILDQTQIRREKLDAESYYEREGKWFLAKETYLALKNNWEGLGRYDDAAWAYRKERRMEKLEALKNARRAHASRTWRDAFHFYSKFVGDQLIEWLCDYGENFWLVLRAMGALWLVFAAVYYLIAGVWGPWQETNGRQIRYITRNIVDLLSFSLGAMTTLTPTDLEARSMLAMRVLMPLEALLGITLAGLLGFVAGNRIRRS